MLASEFLKLLTQVVLWQVERCYTGGFVASREMLDCTSIMNFLMWLLNVKGSNLKHKI